VRWVISRMRGRLPNRHRPYFRPPAVMKRVRATKRALAGWRNRTASWRGRDPLPSHWAKPWKLWSRKQDSNLRLTRRMKPPLYQLSYSALLHMYRQCLIPMPPTFQWLPLLGSNQAVRIQSPVPYQLGEGAMVWCHVRASNPRFRCERPVSWPVRRTWHGWSGRRELNSRLLLGRQQLYHLSYARLMDGRVRVSNVALSA
jgi:hypothetical protein